MKAKDVTVEFKPLTTWPDKPTPDYMRQDSRFKRASGVNSAGVYHSATRMPVGKTITELRTELAQLNAVNIMILLDTDASQIKKDGFPRTGARVKGPGVILTFELANVGAVSYPCDTFTRWEDNLRGITLSLKALRAVNRYGVAKRGEQYRGWKALPAAGTTGSDMNAREAAAWIINKLHPNADAVAKKDMIEAMLESSRISNARYLMAAKKLHPDAPNGSNEAFTTLNICRRVMVAYHGGK